MSARFDPVATAPGSDFVFTQSLPAGGTDIFKGEITMPSYIALLNWTPQGSASVKDSPSRLDAGRKAFKKLGVKIKDTYLTMGRYDLVCVIEAPDDETFARAILSLASQGNVRTETLKAFTEAEYRKIIGSL
jgi:uncharacterized protein with GYD domain